MGDLLAGQRLLAAALDLGKRERAQAAQEVGHVLGVTAGPLRRQALQLALGAGDLGRVEQVAQRQALAAPEQLGQQRGVEGQRRRALLGQRRVALVEELRDVAEHQGAGERRGLRALDVDQGDGARVDVAHELGQARHVEDVLDALADRLEDDGEGGVLAGHLEQLGGPLALLPQRLTAVGPSAGEKQRTGGALAEPGSEQRRPADLPGHQVVDLVGVEPHELEELGPRAAAVLELEVGQPEDDAVVAVHGLHVDAEPLPHPGRDAQRPRCVDLAAEGGVDGDAPVADLVAEPLDDDGAVVGDVHRRLALLVEVVEEVVGGPLVETSGRHPGPGLCWCQPDDLADEGADRAAELCRAPELVALPEGQLAGQTGRGRHEHAVVGDVLDAPGGGAKGEHVADARLVDHLLVELADPPAGALPGGEEHGIQAPVGDGAAAGDGQALGAAAAGQDARDAVPDDAGAQLGELVAGIAAGQHVEDGLEDGARQRGEGGRAVDQLLEVVDGPVVHRAHGDDLLGEDVDRVGGHAQRLDGAGPHPLDDHRRLHEVAAELGEEHAARDGADLVPGAADALQAAGHARRRLHLDDEVDGAHVDAELERAGRHDGGQAPRLEVLLDELAVLLAHRAVVGAGEDGRGAPARARLRHHLGRSAGAGMPWGSRAGRALTGACVRLLGGLLEPLLPDLVEPGREALGEPPGVGEDERGAVVGDQVDDALLDVGPDGSPALGPGRGTRKVVGHHLAQGGHVRDGYDDVEVPLLGRGRAHHLDGTAAREVAGHLVDGLDGGREADALGRTLEHRVEPLEAQGQVGAALGARDRVHLVEDHGLDAGEGLAGSRRQHEEQRLGGGDEDVAGRAGEGPALVGGGVAGADRHRDVGLGQAKPGCGVADADQGRAEVALDVDGQGLHGRDVEHPAALEPLLGDGLAGQPVEGPEERGQRLAGAGRGHDEGVVSRADGLPGAGLRLRGLAEGTPEPRRGGGGEAVEHGGWAVVGAALGTGHRGKPATPHRQPRDSDPWGDAFGLGLLGRRGRSRRGAPTC